MPPEQEIPPESSDKQDQPIDFETWLGAQPDDARTRYTQHTTGLRSALDNERETRKGIEREVKRLAKQSEEGSTNRAELDRLAGSLAEQNHRADFYESAHRSGVSDLRLAYLAARDGGLIDDRGRVDMDGLKARYPNLFEQRRAPTANAGTGTQSSVPDGKDINTFIRRSVGR